MTSSPPDLAQLRAVLATLPRRSRPRTTPATPAVPFEPLPPLAAEARRAIEAAAIVNNDRYLADFLELHSICPFARGGRARGETRRIVHVTDRAEVEPFLALFHEAADDPTHAVIQVIVPMIEVAPEAWIRFCQEVTAVGNQARGEAPVFAVAPLHPELRYSAANPFALIPLFRRTPDPTIQWVRLDALARLYAGRGSDKVYVDPDDLDAYLARPRKRPLFERIAETNYAMAARLGIAEVERTLRELASAARRQYAQVLLGAETPARPSARGCPHRALVTTDTSPPRAAQFQRDGRWALTALRDLPQRTPRRYLVEGVEIAVVRIDGSVHVLHGRCPHRNAPLTDAVVEVDRLVCPHHGWDFQLATGRSEGVPGAQVARFHAWIDDGLVWIDGGELGAWREAHVAVFGPGDDVL